MQQKAFPTMPAHQKSTFEKQNAQLLPAPSQHLLYAPSTKQTA